jgi:preprotein translocase subunit SecG
MQFILAMILVILVLMSRTRKENLREEEIERKKAAVDKFK